MIKKSSNASEHSVFYRIYVFLHDWMLIVFHKGVVADLLEMSLLNIGDTYLVQSATPVEDNLRIS